MMQNKVSKDDAATAGENGETMQFLTFTIGNEEYGVDIMTVREVKGWTETTRLPNMPNFMRGVLNLRGVVIPIFDLRARFGGSQTQAHEKNVVIIVAVENRLAGMLVDAVSDILTVNTSEIRPAPSSDNNVRDQFINGLIPVDRRMVVLLALDHLFDTKQIEKIIDQAA